MSRTLIPLLSLACLFSICPPSLPEASGEEQHQEFLEGLRNRGYYDYALYYLDKLTARTDLPAEVKQVIPYERAVTLLEGAKQINTPELRDAQLDLAVAQLEAFTRDNPNHPLAGKANTQQARILIEKANVKIWESKSPANKENQDQFRGEARGLLAKARETFQKAHDLHKAHYESFPKHIPKEDPRYDSFRKAEIDYMRAQIDLALCTYADAQTYVEGSEEFKNLLTKAANEFKDVHERYRSMVGGLYARMWQGKCFEEQGGKEDIGKALGIYNELLSHPGKSQAMKDVQHQVRQFRLICLNNDHRKDYQLVVNEADEWLNQNRRLQGFVVGLGIKFQKAIAHEKLADKIETEWKTAANEAKRNKEKEPPKPKGEIENHIRKALVDAREVSEFAGQYKSPSSFMVSRLKAKLGIDEGDPKTLNEALVKGEQMRERIVELEEAVKAAKTKQEIANAQDVLQAHLNETVRVLNLALSLADETADPVDHNTVRFLLCYVYYKLERNYEAAVIGDFLARKFANDPADDNGKLADLAQKGATVARAAWYQEYQARNLEQADVPQEQRQLDFELDRMTNICELTTELWPESALADESRMTLGRIYSKRGQPKKAAEWFKKVTSQDAQAQAKVSAGQAYWSAYLNGSELPADQRPSAEELISFQAEAKKILGEGLDLMITEVPEDAPVDDANATDLILARVTLGQIHVYEQEYDDAIKLLTDTKDYHHAPLDAVKIEGDEQRPAIGVKSQNFARLVYQVLLRAYVGKQQTEKAREILDDLEDVVGKENTEQLSHTYRQLGEQIGKELDRLKAEGPKERFDTILASFNTFLDTLYQPERRQAMSVGALQWMGETFMNLGDSLEDDPNSQDYFTKSVECFREIINRGNAESPKPKWLTGMKLRLADSQRTARQFDQALATMTDVLKEYPDAPNVQSAAAQLLQDWGFAGQSDAPERLLEAIQGRKFEGQKDEKQNGIKGWGGMARQYELMLRPIRSKLRELRRSEERILAFRNTITEKAAREARVKAAEIPGESSPKELQDAQDALAVITDAEAATKQWIKLRMERERLRAETNKAADAEKLKRMEQISRFLNHMVDSQYYDKLTSGNLKKEYEEQIAKLKETDSKDDKVRIAHLESLLEEIKLEATLLPPAFRTGQRILKTREKLTALLVSERDQLEKTANANASGSAEALLKNLEVQIDAVKPEGMDDERIKEVQEEIAAAQDGRFVSRQQLQQELKVLRNAVNAWTVYELISADLAGAELDKLELEDPALADALNKKSEELAAQIAEEETKEADLYRRLLEVLHHVAETRHQYAKVQSSNVEKEKALRRAMQDTASVAQRVPRADINSEWWNKFNATYKSVRTDLSPLLKDGETMDPAEEIPVPVPVETDLTWVERSTNTSIADDNGGTVVNGKPPEAPKGANMTWVIVGVLLALGGTGAMVFFMMGSQKKKPFRVNYGAGPLGGEDEKISFPVEGFGAEPAASPAPAQKPSQPRPKKKPAAAGQPPQKAPGQAPKKASSGQPPRKAAPSGEAPKKAAPKKRPPQAAGEPPKPRPKPKPSE